MENPILSGSFTSTGSNITFSMRTPVDWMWVYNYTALSQAAADLACKFYWQRGMVDGRGIAYTKLGTALNDPLTIGEIAAGSGFYAIDTSILAPGPEFAVTAGTAANPPVISSANTPNVGDIVRLFNTTGNRTMSGIDFTVTAVNPGVTFTLGNINTTGTAAITAGSWARIPYDNVFYPRARTISYITPSSAGTVPAGRTRIYTTVTHGYVPGQKVRLQMPGLAAVWGNYAALDGVLCTVTAVNTARNGNEPNNAGVANNFDVDINSAGFGTWILGAGVTWLVDADYPQAPANVVPVGENVSYALYGNLPTTYNELAGSQVNRSIIGMTLAGGAAGPAGAANDVMFWVAGTSFDNDVRGFNNF